MNVPPCPTPKKTGARQRRTATRADARNLLALPNIRVERHRNLREGPDLEGIDAVIDLEWRIAEMEKEEGLTADEGWVRDVARWLPPQCGGGLAIQFSEMLWFIIRRDDKVCLEHDEH